MDTPTISNSAENANANTPKPLSFSTKLKIKKSQLLSAYYGHPIEDLDLILFAGKHRDLAAKITHGALTALGQKSNLLDAKIAPAAGTVHKFLSDSWKKGANFAIIPTPVFSLTNLAFYGLPVKIFSLTSELPPDKFSEVTDFCIANSAFVRKSAPAPMKINLWQEQNSDFTTKIINTLDQIQLTHRPKITTFGFDRLSDIVTSNIKTYKHGTEATIIYTPDVFKIATFDTSENLPEALSAAISALITLGFSDSDITDAIADWDINENDNNSK